MSHADVLTLPPFYQNDTRPSVKVQLVDVDPQDPDNVVPLNLAGVLRVEFHLVDQKGTTKLVGDMTIVDAANGDVEYAWQPGDLDTPGTFVAWVAVYWAADDRQTMDSIQVIVRKRP